MESGALNRSAALWAMRLFAIGGAAVSAYLLYVGVIEGQLPAGCGGASGGSLFSGCEAILNSRWNQTFGLPLSAASLAIYLLAFALTFVVLPPRSIESRSLAWRALAAIAFACLFAAAWLVGVQIFVFSAICPWCIAGHAAGIAFAVSVFIAMPKRRRGDGVMSEPLHVAVPLTGSTVARSAAFGALAVAVLITGQYVVEPQPSGVVVLPPEGFADSGPGPDRTIEFQNGAFILKPHELPMLGSPDAESVIALLFDYCCPHCQALHGMLEEAVTANPDRLGVMLLPMPMDSDCNPYFEQTLPRFEESCDIARLALAVHRAAPERFADVDQWIFASEMPPTAEATRLTAESIVGEDALREALADPWIDERIAAHAEAFHRTGAAKTPAMLSVNVGTVLGRPDDVTRLLQILDPERSRLSPARD